MNWDAIGAFAELLGAVGVIASLVYLAGQIRQSRDQMSQNTKALRAQSAQQGGDTLQGAIISASSGPAHEEAVRLGLRDSDGLSEEDAHRFNMWMTNMLMGYENLHYQYRAGMLDEDRWRLRRSQLGIPFANPAVASWWKKSPNKVEMFGPEFVALVEEILGEELDRGDEVGHVSVGAS